MDSTPDRPTDADDDAPPPVSAMDRVQDRSDYLDTHYERDYNRRYVEEHGDHSGFQGSDETDAEFAAKNPDGADPEAHRSTYEVLGDDASEPIPNSPSDPTPGQTTLGRLFLAPDPDFDDVTPEDVT